MYVFSGANPGEAPVLEKALAPLSENAPVATIDMNPGVATPEPPHASGDEGLALPGLAFVSRFQPNRGKER
jgi:hypothetical protein